MRKAIDNLETFVEANKEGISYILGIKPRDITSSDIKLLCNYLVPETERKSGDSAPIDPDFINKIRGLSAHSKGEMILFSAMEAIERRNVFGKKVSNALRATIKFSPRLEVALENRRKTSSRESFKRLADNFTSLKRNIVSLKHLLDSPDSFNDSKFRFKVNMAVKRIQSDLRKCDYHARAGMTWAIKSGVSVESASQAIHQIYLRHTAKIEYSFKIVDQLLQSQGIRSTMSKRVLDANKRWVADIEDAKQIVARKTGESYESASQSFGC